MPCVTYPDPAEEAASAQRVAQRERERLDLKTLLCSACTALERLGYDFSENPLLDQWNTKHKAEDEARIQEEAHAAFERRRLLEALNKSVSELTDDEKKLLKQYKYL